MPSFTLLPAMGPGATLQQPDRGNQRGAFTFQTVSGHGRGTSGERAPPETQTRAREILGSVTWAKKESTRPRVEVDAVGQRGLKDVPVIECMHKITCDRVVIYKDTLNIVGDRADRAWLDAVRAEQHPREAATLRGGKEVPRERAAPAMEDGKARTPEAIKDNAAAKGYEVCLVGQDHVLVKTNILLDRAFALNQTFKVPVGTDLGGLPPVQERGGFNFVAFKGLPGWILEQLPALLLAAAAREQTGHKRNP